MELNSKYLSLGDPKKRNLQFPTQRRPKAEVRDSCFLIILV